MRKHMYILVVAMLFAATSFGQGTGATPMLGSNGKATDTVTNTANKTWTLKLPGAFTGVSVQFTYTKISGTVAGSVVLLGSNEGVSYDTVYIIPTTVAPTYTATDVATFTKIWTLTESKYLYYRVKWTGTGTMSASAKAYLVARNTR